MKSLRLGIIANTEKPVVAEVLPPFFSLLNEKGISFTVADDLERLIHSSNIDFCPVETIVEASDFVLSFGGDGTFLRTAHLIAQSQIPIIGVNLGTFGYLAEVGIEQLEERINDLIEDRFTIQNRSMLKAVLGDEEEQQPLYGLNDIVIENGEFPKMIRLVTRIDGEYLNTFNADGLIVSTPTGSTGYSLSVGGPIVEPEVKAMIINPINPHMLANRPLVVSADRQIEITTHSKAGHYQIVVDGHHILRLNSNTKVSIVCAVIPTRLVLFHDHDFYALLRNKLQWRHQLNVRIDPTRLGDDSESV
ncbi:MAG: NAD(+)/NADH kinase [Calditrichaeota bacterium]|nr:NAD(+)/NADH kinase [Calditrichota bacterium]